MAGSLSQQAGDIISQHVPLYAAIARLDTSIIIQHTTDREDWQYMCINPLYNGIEMRPVGDLYELVFINGVEHAAQQTIFTLYPRKKEHPTADLYSKHPTKPHHWKFEGRKSDASPSPSSTSA